MSRSPRRRPGGGEPLTGTSMGEGGMSVGEGEVTAVRMAVAVMAVLVLVVRIEPGDALGVADGRGRK